jgi:hypothetical protein
VLRVLNRRRSAQTHGDHGDDDRRQTEQERGYEPVRAHRPSLVFTPPVSSEQSARVAALLHEAAETHHTVYRITEGDDPDWASWYANWLLDLSELPDVLGSRPVRSHLVHALVELDREFTSSERAEGWEDWYAGRIVERFGA